MLEGQTRLRADTPPIAFESKAPERMELVPALLSISKSIRALRGIKLAAIGFNNGQDEMLMAIPDEGMPVAHLADRLMIRPSTVSKMTDRLIEKGLVERAGDLGDARRTIVRITSAGLAARTAVVSARLELEEELTKAIDEDDLTLHRASLSECAMRLERRLKRLR